MEALITAPGNTAVIEKIPIPEPTADEIRIEVRVVSLNPVDALYTIAPPAPNDPGRVVGSDFAGVVDKVGENVKQWQVGDRVTGFVQGATAENRRPGGFAEYAILEADLAIRIPSDVSFEEASTLPLCALTAAQMLFITLGLKAPFKNPAKVTNKLNGDSPAILIYSAATSVGIFAIDLALIARTSEGKPYRVFATASPKHHEKLLKQGVEAVFDYRDPDWPAKARKASGGIVAALDCIAEGESTAKVSHSFVDGGGIIATVRRESWSREGVKEGVTGIYSAVWAGLGHELTYYGKHIPASEEWRAFTVEFYKYLSAHPQRFPITHITPRVMPNGLHGIVPLAFPLLGDDLVIERNYEGLAEHQKPISAEKLVFPLKPQPKLKAETLRAICADLGLARFASKDVMLGVLKKVQELGVEQARESEKEAQATKQQEKSVQPPPAASPTNTRTRGAAVVSDYDTRHKRKRISDPGPRLSRRKSTRGLATTSDEPPPKRRARPAKPKPISAPKQKATTPPLSTRQIFDGVLLDAPHPSSSIGKERVQEEVPAEEDVYGDVDAEGDVDMEHQDDGLILDAQFESSLASSNKENESIRDESVSDVSEEVVPDEHVADNIEPVPSAGVPESAVLPPMEEQSVVAGPPEGDDVNGEGLVIAEPEVPSERDDAISMPDTHQLYVASGLTPEDVSNVEELLRAATANGI
ncbi:hypothetical protein DXG01_002619 [Tephrocybe rancida]|nr:hypothetical protein DXG01_002619 [Tephrocybe rancida]